MEAAEDAPSPVLTLAGGGEPRSIGTAAMHGGVGVTFQRPCDVPPPPVAFVRLVPRVG